MASLHAARLVLFGTLAWLVPPLVAGALGWRGIWGGSSAFVDYLIPIPVAGGALHVPSFAVMLAAVHRAPHLDATWAARARALALGAALTAALMLFPPPAWRLSENPLALFVLADAGVALLALGAAPRSSGRRPEAGALLAFLAVPALAALVVWQTLGLGREFRLGMADLSGDLALATVKVEVRGDISREPVRQRALKWALAQQNPELIVNVEVIALRFVGRDPGEPSALLCLYEDGTPARWLPAEGDCLAGFVTFASRLSRHASAIAPDTPRELKEYLVARAACAEIGWRKNPAVLPLSRSTEAACGDLERRRSQLAARFPDVLR